MYAKKTLVPRYNQQSKKNQSNDPKLGNFQMWLIAPGQSLRSFNLLHIQDSFNIFQNTISGIINIHSVVRISYFSDRLLFQTFVEFGLRRPRVATFADIIKIIPMLIKAIFRDSENVKRITNYVSKCNLYLQFLIQKNLLFSNENMLMSEELRNCFK